MKWRVCTGLFLAFVFSCRSAPLREDGKESGPQKQRSQPGNNGESSSGPGQRPSPESKHVDAKGQPERGLQVPSALRKSASGEGEGKGAGPGEAWQPSPEPGKDSGLVAGLLRGITPADPDFVKLEKLPRPRPLEAGKEPSPLRSKNGRLFYGNSTNPAFFFTIPGASPYFASLLGMDFIPLHCSHERAFPSVQSAAASEAVGISYSPVEGAALESERALRAQLGLFLSFSGPLGDFTALKRILPDVVASSEGLPYSPLHPFGKQLYGEYIKSCLLGAERNWPLFVQPAGPVPFLPGELETWKSFRSYLESKYSTIERANRVWGTNFQGFWEVVPPVFPKQAASDFLPLSSSTSRSQRMNMVLRADWEDYLYVHLGDVAQALTGLVHDVSAAGTPLSAIEAPEGAGTEPVASGADTCVFDLPLIFRAGSGPVVSLKATYMEALSKGGRKPVLDFGTCTWPEDTASWRQLAFLRHFIWRRIWHGASALALPLDAGKALCAAPRFKAEVEGLSCFFSPEQKENPQILFLHPAGTLRGLQEQTRSEAIDYLLAWWKPLALKGFRVKTLSTRSLRSEDLRGVRAVVSPLSFVISDNAFSLLERFAQEGGIVVTDWFSFGLKDKAGRRRNTRKFLGLRAVLPLQLSGSLRLSSGQEVTIQPRPVDGTQGGSAELLLARPYGLRAGRRIPTSAINQYGQGYVYTVLVSLPEKPLEDLLGRILWDHGVSPGVEVTLDGKREAPLSEVGCKEWNEKRLAVLFNLGPPRTFTLSFLELGSGTYTVRNPLTDSRITAPGGEFSWEASELREGLKVFLERGEVATALLEKASGDKLSLKGISRKRRRMLMRLGKRRATGPLLLMPAEPGSPFPLPTARELLGRAGFRMETFSESSQLKNAALVWINRHTGGVTAEELLEFVSRGGGMILEACSPPGKRNSETAVDLLEKLRFKLGGRVKPKEGASEESMVWVESGIASHPATEGVSSVAFPYARDVTDAPEGARSLVQQRSATLVSEYTYGAGRIVVLGTCSLGSPLFLELGDNALLLAGCALFAAGRPPAVLREEELTQSLFICTDSLKEAFEEDKRVEDTTLRPYPVMGDPDPFPGGGVSEGPYWTTFSPGERIRPGSVFQEK